MPRKSNTRAASGAGTIRQRPDGRWEARYSLGRDNGTGKQIQKSVYGATQAEVSKKLREITTQIDSGTFVEPCKMKLSAWLDVWLAEYLGGNKSNTRYGYSKNIENHIKPALGNIPLQKLNAHDIQKFYNSLQKPKGEKKALSAKTIRNIHGTFHKALEQAVRLDYIRTNPTSNCIMPRIEKKEMNYLDSKQLKAFLTEIEGKPYGDLFFVDVFTGMRKGEIMGLTWDCVDFKSGTILINKQLILSKFDGTYSFAPLKNDKPRKITPAPSVMLRLQEIKRKQAENRLAMGTAWQNNLNLIFTKTDGSQLTFTTVSEHLERALNVIGAGKVRFHDLRHSYAVNAIQSGIDVKTISETLGHATVAFTLDIYGHVSDEMHRQSADKMEQFITALSNN